MTDKTTAGIPEDAAVDERPVLDGVVDEAGVLEEGIDAESMPKLHPMNRMLPSKRMKLSAEMVELVQLMPKEWTEGDGEGIEIKADSLDDLMELDMSKFVTLFEGMEKIVFAASLDKAAMEEWITTQDDPNAALMYAFNLASEQLGN